MSGMDWLLAAVFLVVVFGGPPTLREVGLLPTRKGPLWLRKYALKHERIPQDGRLGLMEWADWNGLKKSFEMPAPPDLVVTEQSIEQELRERGRVGE